MCILPGSLTGHVAVTIATMTDAEVMDLFVLLGCLPAAADIYRRWETELARLTDLNARQHWDVET